MTPRVATVAPATPGDALSELLPAVDDSALALALVRLTPRERLTLAERGGERDLLLYGVSGSGTLSIEGERRTLPAAAAGLVLAGEEASLEAGADGCAALCARVAPDVDLHAPMGARESVVLPEDVESTSATGARSFEILLGPHVGSTRATLFVGHVPPGKAPWHYHLYDEMVWIPEGPGRVHVGGAVEELAAGSAFRLRPREVHIVENASGERELALVGVFTPAGSPSAAYLTEDAAAEYRIAG